MDQTEEIDARAEALRADPESFAAMDALWRSVYALRMWCFIARGPDDAPTPFVGGLESGPMVFAFTTGERARAGALHAGLSDEDASRVLKVPMPAALEWIAAMGSSGVAGVVFDLPRFGYSAPLQNLLPMRDFMAANPPA
ncbi:hypothetical protein [Rathayibacter sp. AY1B5]|uniref:hypothetical protein n=1 Tax=Rathayibacter sp. AY1B5 TaxID=2080530 RepID=UPI000CE8D131|nr:hypothetical protein [Rathayibacter sp. AY1B5]PPI21575.1 hypothetical protein C5D44_14820 [Rathayibacter sp. AY1B5]